MTNGPKREGWSEVAATDIVSSIVTGKKDVNQAFASGQYPFFSCAREATLYSNDAFLDANAILVVGNGSYTGFVRRYSGPFDLYQRTYALHDFKEGIDWRFVYYIFKYYFERQFGGGTTGAAIPYITKPVFSKFKFLIPDDIKKQTRIADILSAYDDLIENNRRRVALLEQAARELYREWFVRFRFPGHEHVKIVDGVPEGWERGPISNFYDTASGGTPSRSSPDYYTGTVNWVKTKELSGGFISTTEEQITHDALRNSSAKIFPANTVLVAMYGATIGQVAVLNNEASTNQACCAFLPKNSQNLWIYMFLFLKESKEAFVSLGQGAAQNNISQQVLRNFELVMPPPEILTSFTENLFPMLELWRTLEKSNLKLSMARDFLLPRLMNGSIAV